jgi:alkanesulfonate monooxygenase SsuD/methylene tetrahydromethanopterin reductase-like flavin-dependent oxidoreductase (luciferase family)
MKLGLLVNAELPIAGMNPRAHFDDLCLQVAAARDAGFSAIGIPHHHSLNSVEFLHPIVALAGLAAHAGSMTVATTVYIAGQYQPVEVAEQLSTLDALCGGNLCVGLASGWVEREFHAMGVDYEDRWARFTELVELVRRLWTGEVVTHSGRHFKLDNVRLMHLPVQKPSPPLWFGGSGPRAARFAAQQKSGFIVSGHSSDQVAAELLASYREAFGEGGTPFVAAIRNCRIGERQSEGWSGDPLEEDTKKFAGLSDQAGKHTKDWDTTVLNGAPKSVLEQLEKLSSALRPDLVFLRIQMPGMTGADVLRAIESVGRHILPPLKASGDN